MDIGLVLGMTEYDIDDLHYFTKKIDPSSALSKEEKQDTKTKEIILIIDLVKGFKILVKIFVSFHKHLRAEGVEIYFDWTNIDLKTFTHYLQYIYDGNVTIPTPAKFAKPEPGMDESKPTPHRYS